MKRLMLAALLAASTTAHAVVVCQATTRGPQCRDIPLPVACPPGTVAAIGGAGVPGILGCVAAPATTPTAEVPSTPVQCTMTLQWSMANPEDPLLVALTPTCDGGADMAAARMVVRLLGGK